MISTATTNETKIQSPRLRMLQERLASDPDRHRQTLVEFWQVLAEEGAPLVEPDASYPEHGLVTWLFRETDRPIASIAIQEPFSWKPAEERQLCKLEATDIWYLSWWVRLDLRGSYRFRVRWEVPQVGDGDDAIADPYNRHREPDDWGALGEEESVLVMPDAASLPWWLERPEVSRGTLHSHLFRSKILGNERPIWVHLPAGFSTAGERYPYVVIFDGEANHSAPRVLDNLIAAGKIPPVIAILVNQIDIRNDELPCNPEFSLAIATELIPWARGTYHLSEDPALAALNGRSFGGLCSAYTALKHPDVFGNVFMQSGSCWMHPSVMKGYSDPHGKQTSLPVGEGAQIPTIIDEYMRAEKAPIRIFQETGSVENGPPPARIWQTFGNRWFRDIVALKGYDAHYREFSGGHDDAWWRGTFADGIIWIFGQNRQ